MKTIVIFFAVAALFRTAQTSNCWKDAYGRGVGKPIHTCNSGNEQDGGLCYPVCHDGFKGVGPVCWQNCPLDFSDTGADCLKPESYGRGAGYVSISECESHTQQRCEEWGALFYPKCKEHFHNVACCVCSPDCPNGMLDIGVSCQKQSYGRGAGTPLTCSNTEQYDAGLCYDPCKNHYDGVGPVCWGQCPTGKYDCSALCVDGPEQCTDEVKNIAKDVIQLAIDIAEAAGGNVNIIDIIEKIGKLAIDLANGICKVPTAQEYFLIRTLNKLK